MTEPRHNDEKTYAELFKDGPPLTVESMELKHFADDIYTMIPRTHDLIEKSTLCFAVWKRQQWNLLDAYDEAFTGNRLCYVYEELFKENARA